MNLLEHEAKRLLADYDIPIPRGTVLDATSPLPQPPVVLKSQVPVGGRGKAGGVRIVTKTEAMAPTIAELLSLPIGPYTPSCLLAEEVLAIKRELYLALMIDIASGEIICSAHRSGGVDIERHDKADFFHTPLQATHFDQVADSLADYLELPAKSFVLADYVRRLHRCFIESDALLIEINPLILTTDDRLVAGDAKLRLDSAARFRHPDWDFAAMGTDTNFVSLDPSGHIGTVANGAGLAMETVDSLRFAGLSVANFLDIGGGASKESVLKAFSKITAFPDITAIVINIFAGITRCDEVARAIIAATEETDHLPKLYIRLAGTGHEAAVTLLDAASITTLPSLETCIGQLKKDLSS